MKKNDLVYVDHILNSLGKIKRYISGLSKDEFLKDTKTQDAVIRKFEIVGEATKRISPDFKKKHDGIPWKDMAGMRDVLIHDYIDVDIWIVWKTVNEDLKQLENELMKIQNPTD